MKADRVFATDATVVKLILSFRWNGVWHVGSEYILISFHEKLISTNFRFPWKDSSVDSLDRAKVGIAHRWTLAQKVTIRIIKFALPLVMRSSTENQMIQNHRIFIWNIFALLRIHSRTHGVNKSRKNLMPDWEFFIGWVAPTRRRINFIIRNNFFANTYRRLRILDRVFALKDFPSYVATCHTIAWNARNNDDETLDFQVNRNRFSKLPPIDKSNDSNNFREQ